VTFEVHNDGPGEEAGVVAKGSNGQLLFTSYSRQCAQLWLSLHGRRFANRRDKKPRGQKACPAGTMKAVHQGQRVALEILGRANAEVTKTIGGTSRKRLMSDARENARNIKGNPRLENFRRRTAQILVSKKHLIRLHAREAAQAKAKAKAKAKANGLKPMLSAEPREAPATVTSMLPRRSNEVIVIADEETTKHGKMPEYVRVSKENLKQAKQVVVSKIVDLDQACKDDVSDGLLYAWCAILKQGLTVKEKHGGGKICKFRPVGLDPVSFKLSDNFSRKHPCLTDLLCDGGSWTKAGAKSPSAKASNSIELNRLEDLRRFLVSKRRFDASSARAVLGASILQSCA